MPARIYTRTGDHGETGLFGGARVPKDDARVAAYGDVDELNCQLGVARTLAADADLAALIGRIQDRLFVLGADLATPAEAGQQHGAVRVTRMSAADVEAAEADIDRLQSELAPLSRFILPGGTAPAAALHLARAVCRRAERKVVALSRLAEVNPEALRYLNRLSDLLFVLARAANFRAGTADVEWHNPLG